MSIGNWTNLGTHIQGDVSLEYDQSIVTNDYVDFKLIAFAEKWDQFDIAFEYRKDARDPWQEDAVIIQTTATYLKDNKLFGLNASKAGVTHLIRWKYSDNHLLYGNVPEIRIRILPRIRIFGKTGNAYSISSIYGDSFADFTNMSLNKCIGINNSNQFMCVDKATFFVMNSLSDFSWVYWYTGLSNPSYAIQINSGRYIVSDYSNNRVIELDSTLSTITKLYNITLPIFFDYSEENEILLITSTGSRITEVSWSDLSYGTIIWQSDNILNNPGSATYRQEDVNQIIIADTDNNRIVKYDKDSQAYSFITYYKLSTTDISTIHEISSFYKPIRAYQYLNGNICILEKEGRGINWGTVESSSSSSSG